MGAWNLKEFKTLCLNSGFDKALFYTESLAFKWNAAIYHKGKIQKKMNEINLNSFIEKAPAYDYEISFELDALMVTLNSIWDILGQLLNECFIIPKTPPSDVSFEKITNHSLIPSELKPILTFIKGNTLYGKIKAYANVSKHWHAIQGEIHMDVSKKPVKVSYKIPEFEYKGKWHKLTTDKAFEYLEFVGNSVDQIGAKIHELLN